MYDCVEVDRGLLFQAMVFPLSELMAQAGRKSSLVDDAYVALKDAIRQGALPSGYQGSEQEIADTATPTLSKFDAGRPLLFRSLRDFCGLGGSRGVTHLTRMTTHPDAISGSQGR